MTMEEKISAAREYVHRWYDEDKDAINDAANLWAENYGEYMDIWDALSAEMGV